MYSMKANGNELEHTNYNNNVPDISMSAADMDIDVVGGKDVGMVEGTGNQQMAAAASVDPSSQTQTDQDAIMMEKERIFMDEINRMIRQYNAENKQQDDASVNRLPQKRPASSLTVTHKRRKESTEMNNAVEIEELLKAEEERCVRYGGQWADRVRELMQYRDDHGHCSVPRKHSSLGRWVDAQRTKFKKFDAGKASSMTPHRVKILNYIGFVWDASDKRAAKRDDLAWMQMFEELMEYKEKHGDCLVPNKYKDNPKLGRWVSKQRHFYHYTKKGKLPRMAEERQLKLEEIGFVWKVKREYTR